MDVIDMYTEFSFIGNDFLTWMWFSCETKKDFEFALGKKIVFSKDKDTITIKNDDGEAIVGKIAMLDGYKVSEMQLIYSSTDPRYVFTMKANDLSLNGVKLPKTEGDDSDDEEDGLVLERIYLIEEISSVVDKIFKQFILERLDANEWMRTVQKIKDWINEG